MSYILSDIRIKDPFPKYEGKGLDIKYMVDGESKTRLLSLTNSSLIESLVETENVLYGDTEDNTVRKTFNHSWIGLNLFMEHNLSLSLTEELVLHHLNNKPEKP